MTSQSGVFSVDGASEIGRKKIEGNKSSLRPGEALENSGRKRSLTTISLKAVKSEL